jgi:hypothetical protein
MAMKIKQITMRLISITLSAILLLGVLPLGVFTATAETYYSALELDTPVSVNVDAEAVIFSFVPQVDGVYIFESTDYDGDPRVGLYDSDWKEIDYDVISGHSSYEPICSLTNKYCYWYPIPAYLPSFPLPFTKRATRYTPEN